jgi:hypothetical protein
VHFVKATMNRQLSTKTTYWKTQRGESSARFYDVTLVPSARPMGIMLTPSNIVLWTATLTWLPR